MNIAIFPLKTNQRYYDIHYLYVLNLLKTLELKIDFQNIKEFSETSFICYLDNKETVFDFADDGNSNNIGGERGFKFHYSVHNQTYGKEVYPFIPVSFYDWKIYYDLLQQVKYTCNSNMVLNKQRPYANAFYRRTFVQNILRSTYGADVDLSLTYQQTYWRQINNCLVSVHVPGYCNNMLDRAQLELMALGCCTLSPYLPEVLPFNKILIPGIHYLRCQDDYSDLTSLISWCKNNRERCIEIGENAKQLFSETGTPNKIGEWISECLT